MNFPYSIALCCNGSLLPGLHATLGSLTRHLGQREKVALYLFLTGVDPASQERLRRTVADAGGVGHFQLHEVDLADFHGLETLHGDRTAYLRLKLPDLLPDAPTILYLDSDLCVNMDVCEAFALPTGDAPLGAIFSEPVEWNLDCDIYRQLGFANDERCLNSGVLLINARQWRETRFLERAMEFARTHPTLLRSHDQTILNVFFSRTFFALPSRYNHMISAIEPTFEPQAEIYHFLGSPKPWDPLGNVLHKNWRLWKNVIVTTQFSWGDYLGKYAGSYVSRAWALRKSYARVLVRKFRARFFGTT